jgi:hypothetical protein
MGLGSVISAMTCTSMTISGYSSGYLQHALQGETGVNFNM